MYTYIISIDHYTTGSGYSYTEDIETGASDAIITAEDWFRGCQANGVELGQEDEWITVKASNYNDGDDPAFDSPVACSEYTPD